MPLRGIQPGDAGRVRGREARERIQRHAATVVGLVQHQRHSLLDHLAAEQRVEDVVPARLLLLQGVGGVVGDQAVGGSVQHERPQPLHERAVTQRRRAHAVGAEADEVVEVEQQVVGADLHRHRPAASLLVADELGADRAGDVHDLDPHVGVRGQVQRPVNGLLLDERRSCLVVRHRVGAALLLHPRQAGLQQ